jgi:hypothetical protein
MTLTIYRELEQGSQEWIDARCGILTASVVGKLLTNTLRPADNETSRGLIEALAAERISGFVDYVHPSFDMQRGTLDEPLARDLYAEHYAPVEEIGFGVRGINGHQLGASPDGLIGTVGGLEIKSRRPRTHLRTMLNDVVPSYNLAQMHTCMKVFDREWWDYVSYAGGWPLYVKRVHRDPRWDDAITNALDVFENGVTDIVNAYAPVAAGRPIAERVDHWADEIQIGT